jgi:flavin-dependent dehydrogenase
MMRCDALVIGAGPAGSTAANLLAAAGWSVAIVEKSDFPRRKVCGEFVSAGGAELLGALGVAAAFDGSAGPEVRRVALFARSSAIVAPMPPASTGSHAFGRALGRERLDALMLDQAARRGARVWQPFRASEIEESGDEYVCTLASRPAPRRVRAARRLRAPVVIAAHGSWERGGLPSQAAPPQRTSDWLAFKAHFRNADLRSDLMPLLAFPGGYGGLVNSDGGRVSLSCCIRRPVLESCRRDGSLRAGDAVLAHILRTCLPARACLAGARLEDAWLGAGPLAPGIRVGARPGAFAVGNAAGEAHPVIAEGISMAIQGAALLAALLVEEQDRIGSTKARARLERRYAAAWRKRFAARIRAAALFARLASADGAAEALLPLVRAFPAVLTLGARWSGKADAAACSTCEPAGGMRA